ncbi:MAG: nucleoside deaminase [Bacilli bacterium]|nr:nucleoside deaminase [Bacilli bacterium]
MDNFFKICIDLAKKAAKKGEVPIGAIIVYNGKILAKSFNLREKKHDITAHAEVLAIKKASRRLKRWNLNDCDLYVTLKPCSMCENIIKQSRIKNVYYLCEKLSFKKEYDKTKFFYQNHIVLSEEYSKILSSFFAHKR